jgi:K(+)-stimulated pyrophosphate-energized sodium pump
MEQMAMWAPGIGIVGLIMAFLIYRYLVKQPTGNAKMREIAAAIHEGAMTFLVSEYKIIAVFMAALVFILGFFINWQTAAAYVFGGASSMLAG